MIIYPAIDIRGGRCVRLVEGDFNRETAFDADPVDAALRWADAGAAWIHVVDLDGSVAGKPVNTSAIRRICAAVRVPVQLGGGLRSMEDIDEAITLGANRVVLGTAAVRTPDLVEHAVDTWEEAIAIGLDARDGKLAATGWLEQTDVDAIAAAVQFEEMGVEHLIFTDIRRDGTLRGPNIPALTALRDRLSSARVIASGGVGSIEDLIEIAAAHAAGAIVGRALYDGRIDLAAAISSLTPASAPAERATTP